MIWLAGSSYETEELTANSVRASPQNDCHKSQQCGWKMQSLTPRDSPTTLCTGARHIRKAGLSSRHTPEPYTGGQHKYVRELKGEKNSVRFNLEERKLQGDVKAIFEYLKYDSGRFCAHGPCTIHSLHPTSFYPANQTDLFRLLSWPHKEEAPPRSWKWKHGGSKLANVISSPTASLGVTMNPFWIRRNPMNQTFRKLSTYLLRRKKSTGMPFTA